MARSMSSSDQPIRDAFARAVDAVEDCATTAGPDAEGIESDDVRRLLALAVRLYAIKDDLDEMTTPLTETDVTATQAVIGAAALMHAQHLNPFDLQLWISRTPE